MKTVIKLIIVMLSFGIVTSSCTNMNKNSGESVIVSDSFYPNDSTIVFWEGIYTGLIPINGSDEIAAIWLNDDSTYILMTTPLDNSEIVDIIEGNLTINNNVIQVPVYDSILNFGITDNALSPLTNNLTQSSPIIKEKYKMLKKGGITETFWKLKELNGEKIKLHELDSEPYVMVSPDSTNISGNCGCNNFMGNCKIKKRNRIDIEKVATTQMYCPSLPFENEVLDMLNNTNAYLIVSDTLILFNGDMPVGMFIADYLQQ